MEASVHAKRSQARPSRMNIHEANVHVSTSLRFDCWCNFLFYLPHNVFRVCVYASHPIQKRIRVKRNGEEKIIIAEKKRMNERQCANNRNQTKRQKSLFVRRVDDVCVMCVRIIIYGEYVQFAGWFRSSSNWGNNARNRYRIVVCSLICWVNLSFTSLISTATPAWFCFSLVIFPSFIYKSLWNRTKNIAQKLHSQSRSL